jgi:hypothetical protein
MNSLAILQSSLKQSKLRYHHFSTSSQVNLNFGRSAPRKPRLLRRGRGELYEILINPYREAPTFRAGSFTWRHTNNYFQISLKTGRNALWYMSRKGIIIHDFKHAFVTNILK